MPRSRFQILIPVPLLAGLAFLLCGCGDLDTELGPVVRPQSTPQITGVAPNQIFRSSAATLAVTGSGFLPGLTAFVGRATARDSSAFLANQIVQVRFVSVNRVELILPPTLPSGVLDVTVINPDDGLARLGSGLTVNLPAAKPRERES